MQRREIIGDFHPMRARLAQDHTRDAARGIHREQIEATLVARKALHVQSAAILGPVDACQIDIGVGPKVDAGSREGRDVEHVEFDACIGAARARIALAHDRGAGGIDLRTFDDVDGALIDMRECDSGVVGAPPVTRATVQFLLRDELRRTPARVLRAPLSESTFGAASGRYDVEIVVAYERHILTLRRDLGVAIGGCGACQLPYGSPRTLVEPQLPFNGHDDVAPLFVPRVLDDAVRLNTLAFAQAFLGLRKRVVLGSQCGTVDEQPRAPA